MASTTDPAAPRHVFTVNRAELLDALTTVRLPIMKQPNLPSLGGVRIDTRGLSIMVLATDLDTTISVNIAGEVDTPGSILVDHAELLKLLGAMVKGLPKRQADAMPVTIVTDEAGVSTLDMAGYSVPLTTYATQNFPSIPEPGPMSIALGREQFTSDLARVMVAAGTDRNEPALTGIDFWITAETLRLAATDRTRFTAASIFTDWLGGTAPRDRALLPAATVAVIVKRFTAGQVELGMRHVRGRTIVTLHCGPLWATVTVMINQFIDNYDRLIPAEPAVTIHTDRKKLLAATRCAGAVLDAKGCKHGTLALELFERSVSVLPLLGEDPTSQRAPQQAATITGNPVATRFGFTADRLAGALSTFTGDSVALHLDTPRRPAVLTDSADHPSDRNVFRHLLMPVGLPAQNESTT